MHSSVKKCSNCTLTKNDCEFRTKTGKSTGGRCRACVAAYEQRRYRENREQKLAWQRNYSAAHKNEKASWDKKNYLEKREDRLAYQRWYAKNRRELLLARTSAAKARRRTRRVKSLSHADRTEITRCYSLARVLRELFDIPVHVDHIVPLQGKTVSGLHVPWNLRIVVATKNLTKGRVWYENEGLAKTKSFEISL